MSAFKDNRSASLRRRSGQAAIVALLFGAFLWPAAVSALEDIEIQSEKTPDRVLTYVYDILVANWSKYPLDLKENIKTAQFNWVKYLRDEEADDLARIEGWSKADSYVIVTAKRNNMLIDLLPEEERSLFVMIDLENIYKLLNERKNPRVPRQATRPNPAEPPFQPVPKRSKTIMPPLAPTQSPSEPDPPSPKIIQAPSGSAKSFTNSPSNIYMPSDDSNYIEDIKSLKILKIFWVVLAIAMVIVLFLLQLNNPFRVKSLTT
jgi:hypothetical protein